MWWKKQLKRFLLLWVPTSTLPWPRWLPLEDYYCPTAPNGTGIFAYIWLRFMVNVGTYSIYMNHMGWVVRKSAKNRVGLWCFSVFPGSVFPKPLLWVYIKIHGRDDKKQVLSAFCCVPEFIYLPSNSNVFCYGAEDVVKDEIPNCWWLSNPENKRTFDASHPGNDVALDFFFAVFFGKGHKHQEVMDTKKWWLFGP